MRAAGSNKLVNLAQRSLRPRATAGLAAQLNAAPLDPHLWRELLASPGLSSPGTELEWTKVVNSFGDMHIIAPSDLRAIRLEQPHVTPDDPIITPLMGEIWGAQRAGAHGPPCYARTAAPWHLAHPWDALKLADALFGESAKASKISRKKAESANNAGFPAKAAKRRGRAQGFKK